MLQTTTHPGTAVPQPPVVPPAPLACAKTTPVTTPHAEAPEADAPNAEAELAFRFVTETNANVFLTGRAGTGKTTFLHRLRERIDKSYVVVAPTGVAAINAKGATIHSQLQLPFGLLTPRRLDSAEGKRRLAKAKENVLRRIDLLIIDEVSMVRADVMDAIDHKLRRVRRSRRPFGGVQLLLIGDLHQLPPVVRGDEERELAEHYPTPYFFSAKALQRAGLVTVELKRVYRQTDATFVDLLGEVRANRMTEAVLASLNSRYRQASAVAELDGYITLTSHRRSADDINRERLSATPGKASHYRARVSGTFPEGSYPTDETLELKVGAQVMFVKNDRDGAYHNGKIGTVTALNDETVRVDCGPDDGGVIEVGFTRWENTKYSLDKSSKEVDSEVAGSFTQVPLRLAWAITIHKSQGLTFDRVVIDAAAAFAHGQVYVALSRCRSFEGIVLRSRIGGESVRTDRQVRDYTTEQQARAPGQAELADARVRFREQLLRDAFDFAELGRAVEAFRRHGLVEERAYPGLQAAELDALANFTQDAVVQVADNFRGQLEESFASVDLGDDPTPVPERCRQAAAYFTGKLSALEAEHLGSLDLETDNADAHERGEELLAEVRRHLATAQGAVDALAAEQFSPSAYVAQRARLALGKLEAGRSARRPKTGAVKVTNPILYAMLSDWRGARASAEGVRVSQVLTSRSMRAVCAELPKTGAELAAIEGIGQVRLKKSGAEILAVVAKYVAADYPAAPVSQASGSAPVSATVSLSNSMFGKGLSVDDIAAERGYTAGTILGHLAAGIETGLTDGAGLVDPADQADIERYLAEHDGELGGAYSAFGGRFEQGLLKVARALWGKKQRT